jgi:catechol 2,3-dioxygenase-like lactoylglutathione lyase family enzyme
MIQVRRLGQMKIEVRDLSRSLAWYRDRLGFEQQFEVRNGAVIGCPAASLWLVKAGEDTPVSRRLFSFEVSPEEWEQIPEAFAGDGRMVSLDHPESSSRIVEDPDGHAIEFYVLKPAAPPEPKGEEQIVALVDVVGFVGLMRGRSDEEMFRMLDCFYRAVEALVEPVGGRSLKYMGDAVLLVFPTVRAGAVVECLETLPDGLREVWDGFGTTCRVQMRADLLYLAWGRMGRAESFDGIGHGLNRLFLERAGGHCIAPALWELAERQAKA